MDDKEFRDFMIEKMGSLDERVTEIQIQLARQHGARKAMNYVLSAAGALFLSLFGAYVGWRFNGQ